jgi:iron complex outermembrane receptor protein
MNYQSVGVKAYTSLDHAILFNMALNAGPIYRNYIGKGTLTYARGRDDKGEKPAFIRP